MRRGIKPRPQMPHFENSMSSIKKIPNCVPSRPPYYLRKI